MKIPLSLPDISTKEMHKLRNTIKSNQLSIGPNIEEFESKIAKYVGAKYAVAVNSGTSGLHLLVRALGIGSNDEVITTPFSFVASTNCFLYEGARPVFVDIDPYTLNIDINKIEQKINEKTKAILPVDVFGHPLDMKKVMDIAKKHNLVVIEDACEAIGSEYNGIPAGSIADGAVFAFYPNKQITTGEGGAIITNDQKIACLCKSMRNQGRSSNDQWLHHERLGYNYRMDELSAALGSIQMDRLDEIIDKRNRVAEMYDKRLKYVEGFVLPYISPMVTRMSWFVYVIRLKPYIDRNLLMSYLLEKGVSCKPYFSPIHLQPYMMDMFGFKEGAFPITEDVSQTALALPFFNKIKEREIDYVAAMLKQGIAKAIIR